ncbi:Copper type II ascorbate-dependent monooxygenase C-terminal [Trinorchestia longiramus]|nr:Copper type II ascorbate-dependent monooxygenase C-terminal [Trinorchestia longiramus]
MIAKGNPQWPQAFYPMKEVLTISPEEVIAARCTYNATQRSRNTHIGSTKDDEMCNLYLMYYTDTVEGKESATCFGARYRDVLASLPAGNDLPLPPNPLLEEKAHGENTNKNSPVTYKPVVAGSGEIAPAVPEALPAPVAPTTFVPITVEKKAHQFEPLPPQG